MTAVSFRVLAIFPGRLLIEKLVEQQAPLSTIIEDSVKLYRKFYSALLYLK